MRINTSKFAGTEYRNKVYIYPILAFFAGFVITAIAMSLMSLSSTQSVGCISETKCIYTDGDGNQFQFDPTVSNDGN